MLFTLVGCGGALTPDAGGATAGRDGGVSLGGAGGAAGVSGAGGALNTGGGGAFGGHPVTCPPKPQTLCTGTGTPPSSGYAPGPCDQEGNICTGGDLGGDGSGCFLQTWSLQCCAGRWSRTPIGPGGDPVACPTVGSPFSCDPASASSCTVGQTACVQSLDLATSASTFACSNLCAAADCSCFCTPDAQGSCPYTVADPKEPSSCQCGVVRGAVVIFCTHGMEPTYGCMRDPATDATCDIDHPQAFTCVSPDGGPPQTPQRSVCQQFDDSDPNHWCCTTY